MRYLVRLVLVGLVALMVMSLSPEPAAADDLDVLIQRIDQLYVNAIALCTSGVDPADAPELAPVCATLPSLRATEVQLLTSIAASLSVGNRAALIALIQGGGLVVMADVALASVRIGAILRVLEKITVLIVEFVRVRKLVISVGIIVDVFFIYRQTIILNLIEMRWRLLPRPVVVFP